MSLRSGPDWARMTVAVLLAVSPLAARGAAPAANSAAPPASTNTVGPRELRDFNLPGRVTQPAAPPVQAPAPQTAPAPAVREAAPPTTRESGTDEPNESRVTRPADAEAEPRADAPAFPVTAAPVETPSAVASAPLEAAPPVSPAAAGPGWWPWLLALAAALGAAAWWWTRRQRAAEPATAGVSSLVAPAPVRPQPSPAPAPAPVPAQQPPVAHDGGIVSRRLQPRITFEFTPLRIEVDGDGNAGLIYDLVILNAGSAPAREVLVEARMFNAGPDQDREIAAFFNAPQALGDRVPVIAPQQRLPVRSRVLLYADRFAPLEVEGRKLLVPMVAFNALYRGPSGEAQNSASFLVGRVPQGAGDDARMAPFRIDAGARQWSDLGVRAHSGGAN